MPDPELPSLEEIARWEERLGDQLPSRVLAAAREAVRLREIAEHLERRECIFLEGLGPHGKLGILNGIESLRAKLAAAAEQHAALLALVRWALEQAWQGADVDAGDLQTKATALGILRREQFDPEKHEDDTGFAEPGCDWFVLALEEMPGTLAAEVERVRAELDEYRDDRLDYDALDQALPEYVHVHASGDRDEMSLVERAETVTMRLAAAEARVAELEGDADFCCPECGSFQVSEVAYDGDAGSMRCHDCGCCGDPGEDFPSRVQAVAALRDEVEKLRADNARWRDKEHQRTADTYPCGHARNSDHDSLTCYFCDLTALRADLERVTAEREGLHAEVAALRSEAGTLIGDRNKARAERDMLRTVAYDIGNGDWDELDMTGDGCKWRAVPASLVAQAERVAKLPTPVHEMHAEIRALHERNAALEAVAPVLKETTAALDTGARSLSPHKYGELEQRSWAALRAALARLDAPTNPSPERTPE